MKDDLTGTADSATADGEDLTPATSESTRAAIVKSTGSGYVPVRHGFVQKHQGKNRGATLGRLVKARRRRALILYLLVLTSWDPEKRHAPWEAAVWLRTLEVKPKPNLTWSRSSLSETWTELVRLKLVERRREHRLSRITPRREDRRKGEYTRPDGKTIPDRYFILPGAFWTDLWFDRLSLAAVAVLLILLKETNKDAEKHMTYAETAAWYGISESTAKKGYQELVDAELVEVRDESRRANYAGSGFTTERYYSLTGPFSTQARAAARKAATKERAVRLRRSKKATPKPRASARAAVAAPKKSSTSKTLGGDV